MRLTVLVVLLAMFAIGSKPVEANERTHLIKVIGTGNDVELDPRTIPAEMQKGHLAMKMFCLDCHGEERMITTLRTGISPVTKHPYGEAEFSDKIIKIMRSPKTKLDRNNAKTLTEFFHFIITKARLS